MVPAIPRVSVSASNPPLLLDWRAQMARQRLGQHFLGDEGWREKIARAIRVSSHGIESTPSAKSAEICWIEIGAGHGEMTQHLVQTGLPVYAIELDPLLTERLRSLAKKHPNLTVVPGDVLETDLAAVAQGRRIKIYGNLPYYITSPILHHFFQFAPYIDEINLVIQLEVAERLTAEPGTKSYGYLSVATQFYTRPEFVLELPPVAFTPPPEVDSALVTLRLPSAAALSEGFAPDDFLEFVKICFAQKRKTLANNLKPLHGTASVRELLESLAIRSDARAEQLSVQELIRLFEAISSK
jgi:16S rRNA (adenine1518-N6/adenine1519-N6)-dimethyltransferase